MVNLLLFLWMGPGAPAADLATADKAYRAQQHDKAVEELTELTLERSDDRALLERLGAARYRQGDYEGAARAWDHAVDVGGGTDPDLFFNAGNAHYLAGGLERARERYGRALELDPGHRGAGANNQALEAELAERRKPPPPPSSQGEGKPEAQPKPDESAEPSGEEPTDPSEEQGDGKGEERPAKGEPSEGDAKPGEAADPGEGGDGEPLEEAESITEAEAHRLLEGVEEGRHRVHVGGGSGDKPW